MSNQQEMNQVPKANHLQKAWRGIADFFENGDLVPFAIIISVYHYYIALDSTDGLVAIPVAILIDLLHFRTVRHAVRTRTAYSVAIGALTTAMAVFYHYEFYSSGGELESVEAMIHALPIPVGIAVLAWLNETTSVGQEIARLMGKVQEAVTALQDVESQLQEEVTARQDVERQLQEAVTARQDVERQLQEAVTAGQEAVTAREALQVELDDMKAGSLNFNQYAWDMIELVRTGKGRAVDIANKHGKKEATVSRFKTALNTGRAE